MFRKGLNFRGGLKLALTLLALLAVKTTNSAGQGNPLWFIGGEDNTCNNFDNSCTLDHGCTDVAFTPPFDGTYNLCAWVSCLTPVTCRHCAACVRVYHMPDHGLIATCSTDDPSFCGHGVCNRTCTVNLSANNDYRLSVCLVFCSPNDRDCERCTNCVAHGKVTAYDPCP